MSLARQKPRLLLTRRLPERVEAHLSTLFETVQNSSDQPLDRDDLLRAMSAFDAILPTITDHFDAALMGSPQARVRILANFGAGIDHIDLDAARRAGIVVSNTPDALTDATAEVAILLMLMAARRAGEGEREVRDGRWSGWRPTHLLGQGLVGKTLGLVGFGRIAQATAHRAAAFGMHILYHNRRPSAAGDPRFVETLDELASRADILSLHVPGGGETRHMIDESLLARMKPSSILVNTARGSVVDETALANALAKRTIAAAGLDVFETEPHVPMGLLRCPNLVLLPHIGSATIEARVAMGLQAARNLELFFDGAEVPNRIV